MSAPSPIEQSCRHCGLGRRVDGTIVDAFPGIVCPGHDFQTHRLQPRNNKNGPKTPPLSKMSLTKKLITRCKLEKNGRTCEICNDPIALFHAVHIFELSRENEFEEYLEQDDNIPISINNAENGLMICPTCHAYFDCNPRLLAIKKDGTIQLFGLAKEQNYKNLAGKKVPWANKIDTKNWPTSALLDVVYRLPPKTKKRKRTD